jgi:hypothetical protein
MFRVNGVAFIVMVLFGGHSVVAAQEPAATVVGSVSLSAADGQVVQVPGVRLTLTCETDRTGLSETSDDRGEFRFTNVPADTCSLVADLQGFKSASATAVMQVLEITTVEFHLDVEPIYTGMTVTGEPPSGHRRPRRGDRAHRAGVQRGARSPATATYHASIAR